MTDERRRIIDPNGLYPSEHLRRFEEFALQVIPWRAPYLLERTRDVIEIRLGLKESSQHPADNPIEQRSRPRRESWRRGCARGATAVRRSVPSLSSKRMTRP